MDFLQGFTVLDLASVGPAARASRILADYGMEVIKLAPVTAHGAKQIDPVFHAYGGGRGMRRIRLDLKSSAGVAALAKLVARSRCGDREFSTRRGRAPRRRLSTT